MAYIKKSRFNRKRGGKSNKKYNNDLLSFAKKMGNVQRGLQNPDSQISEAFNKGLSPEKKVKKSFY